MPVLLLGAVSQSHTFKNSTSIVLSVTISVVAVSVAVFLLLYSYQRKRKKRPQTSVESINQLNFLGEHSETQQPEEIGNEQGDYHDLQEPFG